VWERCTLTGRSIGMSALERPLGTECRVGGSARGGGGAGQGAAGKLRDGVAMRSDFLSARDRLCNISFRDKLYPRWKVPELAQSQSHTAGM
jgi:hypothetical protein